MARSTVAPLVAPLPHPDPPLVVPAALPAPNPDPAALAEVEFRQGNLTVNARNAALGRLLRLIGAKTGTAIEIAPELAVEPVVAQLGPGSPDEVLAALLSGPRIDFIILGGDERERPPRVVVRRRASFGHESTIQTTAGTHAMDPAQDEASQQQPPHQPPQEEKLPE